MYTILTPQHVNNKITPPGKIRDEYTALDLDPVAPF
jgi:hypothetical protein